MNGLMMDKPLLISGLLKHAELCFSHVEIVSRRVEGGEGDERFHRYTWKQAARRSRQLANALSKLGVVSDDRVGTLAWNGYRHLELYYAVSGIGAVLHTVNPRLFLDQIAWIINHAEDGVLFFDINLAPLVEKLAPHCPKVKAWVAMTDAGHMPQQAIPNLLCYEELLAAESDEFEWPEFSEYQAAALCYTSGTTGNPKGALYSHRSTVLHAFAACMPDAMGLSCQDVALPIVPMFHVNAWGMPYSAPMAGFKLVFPGAALDGASLCELFEREGVTYSAGVPTVWLGFVQYVREHGRKPATLKRCTVGGSATPASLLEAFEKELGVRLQVGWGMTEMSPLGALNTLAHKHLALPEAQRQTQSLKAGRIVFGVEAKIVDGDGKALAHDGVEFGDLYVRGPWIISSYYGVDKSPLVDGWFPTGDVATIDADGFIAITDRSKDVIKSGGEWISSIDLENIAMSHPAVAEAAVIAMPHPKWDERPLVVAVLRPGAQVTREELLSFYEGKIAKWWMPDDVVFVAELPHTATGKVQKVKLRQDFAVRPPAV
jgi:fatty-acyl-CoA synthase